MHREQSRGGEGDGWLATSPALLRARHKLLNPNHLKSQPLSWLYWICTPKPEAAWQKAGTHFPSGGSAKGRSIENTGEAIKWHPTERKGWLARLPLLGLSFGFVCRAEAWTRSRSSTSPTQSAVWWRPMVLEARCRVRESRNAYAVGDLAQAIPV